jgi:ketosteroid isomerase-like protein
LTIAVVAPSSARSSEEEDRQALRQIKDLYQQAVNEDTLDLLAPHVDPSFTGVMLTSEPVTGLEGMKAYWKKMKDMMGSSGRYHVTVSYEPSHFFGDVAVARGTTQDVVTIPGKEFRFTGHWSAVCVKREGAWKIVRIHASMDPLTNPFVTGWIQAGRLAFGGGGAAGGLVLGGLLGLAVARRKAVATR